MEITTEVLELRPYLFKIATACLAKLKKPGISFRTNRYKHEKRLSLTLEDSPGKFNMPTLAVGIPTCKALSGYNIS